MKQNLFIRLLLSIFLCLSSIHCKSKSEAKKSWIEFKDIYDAKANAEQDIQNAINRAQRNNKRVLLIFGANWCPWCQALHRLFESNKEIHSFLADNYEVVLVDLGRRDRNMGIDARYGSPNKLGLPAIVVLEKDGAQLHSQETGALEFPKDHAQKGHDPAKVLHFLRGWAPLRF